MEHSLHDDAQPNLLGSALKRRWPIVAGCAVLLALLGFGYTSTNPPSYTSTAKVLLRPTPGNALDPDASRNGPQITVAMETEAGLIASPGVAEKVSSILGRTMSAADPHVDATVPTNTMIVQITYADSDRKRAQQTTAAYATAYLAYRDDQSKAIIKSNTDSLNAQLKAATDALNKATADSAKTSAPADAEARVQLYTNRVATLQGSLGTLEATSTSPGYIVTPANTPTKASGVPPQVIILGAGILGLLLGVVLALWRERGDDRINAHTEEVSHGVPVLAAFGTKPDQNDNEWHRLRAVIHSTLGHRGSVAIAGLGKSDDGVDMDHAADVAIRLAETLATAGHSVALVEASGGPGSLSERLGLRESTGWTDVPSGRPLDVDALVRWNGVDVLPVGTLEQQIDSQLGGDGFDEHVAQLREARQYVIVVSPTAHSGRGLEAASVSGSLVVVATEGKTRDREVSEVLSKARLVAATPLGVVVVNPKAVLRPRDEQGVTRAGRAGRPERSDAADTRPDSHAVTRPSPEPASTSPADRYEPAARSASTHHDPSDVPADSVPK